MREQEFKQWLESQADKKGITNFYLSGNRRIEGDEKIDLDKEFQENKLERLLKLYVYSKGDERTNLPNPTNLKIDEGSKIYSILSIHRSALREYRKFCEAGDDFIYDDRYNDTDTDADESTDSALEIKLQEDQLQDMMRETITDLEAGLKIIDNGVERKVASGYIDILAQDKDGRFVVIELKVGQAPNSVIAQTLGYMVDIAEKNRQEIGQVRGIIVASRFNNRVETASRAMPNLEIKTYKHRFEFN